MSLVACYDVHKVGFIFQCAIDSLGGLFDMFDIFISHSHPTLILVVFGRQN